MTASALPEYLTPREAADLLRMNRVYVTELLRQGKLPGVQLERRWLIPRGELEQLIEARRNSPRAS